MFKLSQYSKASTLILSFLLLSSVVAFSQTTVTDTIPPKHQDSLPVIPPVDVDSILRIKNLNPFFTLHVDSSLYYSLEINKDEKNYYWFLRNSPIGLKINKDNGTLTFKADKSFFTSGKLKYDFEYKVQIGVQNLNNPKEKIDTFFSLIFYNTETIPSKVKPTVSSVLYAEEGDTVNFKVQCENGSFPIENITFFANTPLKNFTLVRHCDDEFTWSPPFDFVKETDSGKVKIILLSFVGTNKFMSRDTAVVKLIVKDALNFPLAYQEHKNVSSNMANYILQLKYTFLVLDKNVKKTKSTRTGFDITGSTTALTGSMLSTSSNLSIKKTGQVLPSVGVSLVPIKEAVAPQKIFDQNQASLIRTSIKRLDYMLKDNNLVGDKDADVVKKTNKLKDELKQTQVQLIDVPLELANEFTPAQLNDYFNNPKVNKKYRLRK
jgi:hypothetical protein